MRNTSDPDSPHTCSSLCIVTACISKVPVASNPRDSEAFQCVKALDLYSNTEGS